MIVWKKIWGSEVGNIRLVAPLSMILSVEKEILVSPLEMNLVAPLEPTLVEVHRRNHHGSPWMWILHLAMCVSLV